VKKFKQVRQELNEMNRVKKAVAIGMTALAASGCATQEKRIGGYYWVPDPDAPHCQPHQIQWIHKPFNTVQSVCRGVNQHKAGFVHACSIATHDKMHNSTTCAIFSHHSEDDAKKFKLSPQDDGDTLWDHERRHLLDRLKHPRKRRRKLMKIAGRILRRSIR
jgi:hypothetical protein